MGIDRRGGRARLAMSLAALGAAASVSTAFADTTLIPRAGALYQHDDNLFALSDKIPGGPPGRPPGTPRSDSSLDYYGGLLANLGFGRQTFVFDGEARRTEYDRFDDLNNTSYFLDGDLQWVLTSLLDGDVGYRKERRMSSFAEQQGTASQLQEINEDVAKARINLHVTPEWLLSPHALWRDEDSPQPGFPNLGIREKITGVDLKYAGLGKLIFGITTEYLDGRFKGTGFATEPTYDQSTGQLTASYSATGLSSFSSAIGYTKRNQDFGGSSTSAVTGSLGYHRQLTGKTDVTVEIKRDVNSYIAAGSSEIDTGATAGVNWSATRKLTVSLNYAYLHSTFEGELLPGSISAGRKDHAHNGRFEIAYSMLSWLTLRPFVQYEKRTSNLDQFTFHHTVYGLELVARRTAPGTR